MIAPTMTTARITIERIRTGVSIASANLGHSRRITMPIATGINTIANTSTAFENWMPRPSSPGRKYPIARFVISGKVNSATIELIAVSVMFSATSPRNRWL